MTHSPDNLFAVGIASSAGGLTPMLELLEAAHCHQNMCFLLVPHLSRDYETNLPKLIKKVTKLQIVVMENGLRLEPCRIYVLPPNAYASIREQRIYLEHRPDGGVNLAANRLFLSLATAFGKNAVGVVLSGSAAGSDGSEGILKIKAAGGHTYAQDPSTAQFKDMPKLAIQTGSVDFILPAAQIGHELTLVNWAS